MKEFHKPRSDGNAITPMPREGLVRRVTGYIRKGPLNRHLRSEPQATTSESGVMSPDAKFTLTYRPEDIERFASDSENGPVVGFVFSDKETVRLVTLEHNIASDARLLSPSQTPVAYRLEKPARLHYTPKEWVAFYTGVKEGELKDIYPPTGHTYIIDSKDPGGPILVVEGSAAKPFYDAVAGGKYDVPSAQEASLLASFPKE